MEKAAWNTGRQACQGRDFFPGGQNYLKYHKNSSKFSDSLAKTFSQ